MERYIVIAERKSHYKILNFPMSYRFNTITESYFLLCVKISVDFNFTLKTQGQEHNIMRNQFKEKEIKRQTYRKVGKGRGEEGRGERKSISSETEPCIYGNWVSEKVTVEICGEGWFINSPGKIFSYRKNLNCFLLDTIHTNQFRFTFSKINVMF